MVDISLLQAEIVNELTVELSGEPTFAAEILELKVKNAIRDVMTARNYSATSKTDEQIIVDLYGYYSTIVNLARYDYNQIGAEGQSQHTENSVSRTWVDRNSILRSVNAFVKIL